MKHFEYLDWPGPIAYAHRGGVLEAAEQGHQPNTIAAFDYAVNQLGYTFIETDVRADETGKLYTWHGEGVERLDKHRPLKAGVLQSKGKDTPLLSDVLEEFPTTRFAIDPKHWPAVKPLAATIVRMKATDRVSIAAFSQRRTNAAAKLIYEATGREVCTGIGIEHLVKLAGRVATRTIEPWESPNPCVQIPRKLIRPAVIRAVHAGGAQAHVWTLDERHTMEEFLDMGVDGIMTDRPSLLKNVLLARGQWYEP